MKERPSGRRVAVTGLGAITALGPDVASFERGLVEGRTGIRELTLFDPTGFRTRLAGEVQGSTDDPSLTSRPDRFGLVAAKEAVRQAGLTEYDLSKAALIFGTGTGGAMITEGYMARMKHPRPSPFGLESPGTASRPHPDGAMTGDNGELPPASLLVPHQPSSVTDLVGRALGIRGPRSTIMTACSSSATAVGAAADRIRLGQVDVAIAGGAEGLCRLTFAGFSALRATSSELCQPFDADRKGLNLGEGAGVLVLEEYEHARARGATILAFVAGYGITADAHHMTAPHPEGDGAARAMKAALKDAALDVSEIGYVNAHGTATPHNDAAESLALKNVFGARARDVPISSIKSMVGHTLGAAGAIEAVASVLALAHGFLPPTVNLRRPDPAFELDFIPGKTRHIRVGAVLSNSFAFGGNNTSLALSAA